jgi:hypothetical protein
MPASTPNSRSNFRSPKGTLPSPRAESGLRVPLHT